MRQVIWGLVMLVSHAAHAAGGQGWDYLVGDGFAIVTNSFTTNASVSYSSSLGGVPPFPPFPEDSWSNTGFGGDWPTLSASSQRVYSCCPNLPPSFVPFSFDIQGTATSQPRIHGGTVTLAGSVTATNMTVQPAMLTLNASFDAVHSVTLDFDKAKYAYVDVSMTATLDASVPLTTGAGSYTVVDPYFEMQTGDFSGNSFSHLADFTAGGGWIQVANRRYESSVTFVDRLTDRGAVYTELSAHMAIVVAVTNGTFGPFGGYMNVTTSPLHFSFCPVSGACDVVELIPTVIPEPNAYLLLLAGLPMILSVAKRSRHRRVLLPARRTHGPMRFPRVPGGH